MMSVRPDALWHEIYEGRLYVPWWKTILPRLFGFKVVHFSGDYMVTVYSWRGKLYCMKVEKVL